MNSRFIWFLSSLLLLLSCSNRTDESAPSGNAVYYWRTDFLLSEVESSFIKDNDVHTLYVKFFDVVASDSVPRPDATLRFSQKFPENTEIIPTVFIDSKIFSNARVPDNFASMILKRIDSMMTKNGYPVSREVQIDFDWTQTNQEIYFGILKQMSDSLHKDNRRLSTTIRLHQLALTPPPVDYGVLMVYNIGNFASPTESNSILSIQGLKPYLKYLDSYRLPLATALPIYSWDLLFRQGRFVAIARGLSLKDESSFSRIDSTHYKVKSYMPLPSAPGSSSVGARILPNDIIRHEEISYALLDSTLNLIRKSRPGATRRVILYHLDENTINQYKNDELKKVYTSN